MRDIVACCYSHRNHYLPILEEQASARGFGLVSEEIQFSWSNMVLWTLDVCRRFPHDLLFFVGAWDTVCVGDVDELRDLDLQSCITLTGDINCWPDKSKESDFDKKVPGVRSPWRYVNTGPLTGLGANIGDAIDWGWERFPVQPGELYGGDNDQRFWTDLYLQSPFDIMIDYECRVGQTLQGKHPGMLYIEKKVGGRGRVRNDLNDTYPVFVHANGQNSFPPELLEW
jgi:hypothetical protein